MNEPRCLQRAELLKDPYYDPLKLRTRMAKTFLQGWDHIAKHERSLTLPILITYSPIDKVCSCNVDCLMHPAEPVCLYIMKALRPRDIALGSLPSSDTALRQERAKQGCHAEAI